jgi:uncharacterized membrane protein
MVKRKTRGVAANVWEWRGMPEKVIQNSFEQMIGILSVIYNPTGHKRFQECHWHAHWSEPAKSNVMADDPNKKGADAKRVSKQPHEQAYQKRKAKANSGSSASSSSRKSR